MEALLVWIFGVIGLATKACVALIVLFQMLKRGNKAVGVDIEDVLERLKDDPRALADYYGRRLIAAAIVVLGVAMGSF
jgi:hypothetical protein